MLIFECWCENIYKPSEISDFLEIDTTEVYKAIKRLERRKRKLKQSSKMSNLKKKIDKGITEFYLNSDIELIKKSLEEEGVDVSKESAEISKFSQAIEVYSTATVTQKIIRH